VTRVLIVDDKEENLYYLRTLLEGNGATVDAAHHGAEALTRARQTPPDIVVSDLLMPVMDGYTLLRLWKSDARLEGIPFVVYTATYTEPEDERLALGLGADAFIVKPIEPDEFLARLREVQDRFAAEHHDPPRDPSGDEAGLLESYSQTLIRKLEEKTLQLEQTNRALQQDITRREAAEAALRASEAEFRLLAEAMPQLVWIAGPDGRNVYVNQRWQDYIGLTLEEGRAHGWSESFHPEDRRRAREAWRTATRSASPFELEGRLRRADGEHRWWLIRSLPQRDERGEVVKWFGTCTDIHELKVAELAIAESEERFARVFHSGLVAIGIAERSSGRLIDVNESFARFFGYTRDEMVGRDVLLQLFANPEDRERLSGDAGRPPAGTELAFRRRSGELRHALASMEAISLQGTAARVDLLFLVDLTDRRQLEAQLLHAHKMEAVGRLAGGVAHDFNNLLGVILGYAERLESGAQGEQREKVEQILVAARSASRLTRQLLAFSRKQVVEPELLDPRLLLSDLERMLSRLIGDDVELVIGAAPDVGLVRADRGQLEQVIVNLCVNARDAMPGGGVLRIELAEAEVGGASAATDPGLEAGRYVTLSVSDTGSGIAPADLPHVFEPFFTTKEEGRGTGLGLASVYAIVSGAGGQVRVESQPGRGTAFRIYLPRVEGVPSAPPPAVDAPLAPGSGTILVVEDQEALRALAREILEQGGYRVLEAGRADEAIALAGRYREPIDLLLTDVAMPGMKGPALAAALVAARPGLRVLFMSGQTHAAIGGHAGPAQGSLLLQKPFSGRALLQRVQAVLASAPSAGS
jgi:PAS domain S-box-containing protein